MSYYVKQAVQLLWKEYNVLDETQGDAANEYDANRIDKELYDDVFYSAEQKKDQIKRAIDLIEA